MPNPFAPLDRLEFDFDLPSLPQPLERADRWFNRLSELQRIGVALLGILFLVASALYCLGLGSTVLVNRAEAEYAAREAGYAAALPTVEPTLTMPGPAATVLVEPTAPAAQPTTRPANAARPTQITEYPTPIPAQLLPTIPIQAPAQRAVAPVEQARPRIVAPPEPATPTPPARVAAPAIKPGGPASGSGTTPARAGTPTPALAAPVTGRTPTVAAPSTTRPPATAAPVVRPSQPAPAGKPTVAPVIQNPILNPSKPTIVGTPRPAAR